MKIALKIINKAYQKHGQAALAFSGGGDSMVLLDILTGSQNTDRL